MTFMSESIYNWPNELSYRVRPSSIVASTSRCGRDDLSSILRKGIFLPFYNINAGAVCHVRVTFIFLH